MAENTSKTIVIDPVTRIEGHAKITLHLNDEEGWTMLSRNAVSGFEKFCEGRPFSEMPSLIARICRICRSVISLLRQGLRRSIAVPDSSYRRQIQAHLRTRSGRGPRSELFPSLLLTCCWGWTPIGQIRSVRRVRGKTGARTDGIARQFGRRSSSVWGETDSPRLGSSGRCQRTTLELDRDAILAGVPA